MNRFVVEGGQFWLNEKPQLIQAGEIHYFRIPEDQWAHRLGLLKAAGFNALATYIPWLWHQLDEDVSDFDGHSHPMRNLEGFLDLAAKMDMLIIARPGPYIMAETINEGIPPWVFRKYPQAAYISQDNAVQNIASYLQPDFTNCVKKWYQAIFEVLAPRQITRGGKIILVQLDNEMGMMQWVRNIMDINSDTISRFAAYLHQTYGQDLSGRYPADPLEEFIRKTLVNPEETYSGKMVEDYRRYYRYYLREYTSFLWSEARSNGMEVPPVINIHGFANGGKTFPIGLSQLVSAMGLEGMISATDVYPGFIGEGNFHQLLLVNEMTKALQNPKQPLFSIEFQAGGNHDFGGGQSSLYELHSRLCVSSGMRAINHYLFCDGENDPILSPVKRHDWGHPVRKDGTLRKHYARYPKLSRVLNCYGTDLVLARPKTVTTIGFLLDDYMTEVNNQFTKEYTSIITHQRDFVLFDMIAKGLALTHRPFNALELSRNDLDVFQTPNCWVMMEKQCNADTQQKLVDYVQKGGRLILAGRMFEKEFNEKDCTILKDAIGIKQVKDDLISRPNHINAFNYRDVPVSFLQTYAGEFDEVFARLDNGEVAGFIKAIGKGKVLVFGAAMTAETLDDLDIVNQMALKMDCLPLFTLSEWADVRLSSSPKGDFLFINNYQDDPVETTVMYEKKILLGGNPVKIPARSGMILPIEWKLNNGVQLHYSTSEIIEVAEDEAGITLRTAQDSFIAELTLAGYNCDPSKIIKETGGRRRIQLSGKDGMIALRRDD
jgi:beta-galactosidase